MIQVPCQHKHNFYQMWLGNDEERSMRKLAIERSGDRSWLSASQKKMCCRFTSCMSMYENVYITLFPRTFGRFISDGSFFDHLFIYLFIYLFVYVLSTRADTCHVVTCDNASCPLHNRRGERGHDTFSYGIACRG